mmetsp:Transcript_110465/g.330446  ORF Transcript_110465/g.330446 Transcript_110465/m.330446 type:complete len:306 (+) Transcript_110465:155-1072(+)
MADPLRSSKVVPSLPTLQPSSAESNSPAEDPERETIDCRPKAHALFQCGLGRLRLGDVRGAYQDFKEAARIEPRDLEIWQKYEETYRAVQEDVEEELKTSPGIATQQSSTSSARARHPGSAKGRPPQHFSLRRPSEMQVELEALQAGARGSLASEAAVDVQARMFRPAHHRQMERGHEQAATDPTVTGPSASSSAGGLQQHGAQRTIAVTLENNRVYGVIYVSWAVTWLTVLYHYRVQRRKGLTARSVLELVLATGLTGLLLWLLWRFKRRQSAVSLSASDAIKLVSLVVIVGITFAHYCSEDNK